MTPSSSPTTDALAAQGARDRAQGQQQGHSTAQPKAWTHAFEEPGQPFEQQPLELLSGQIPPELRGTLYQNGAARLSRAGQRVGHWFDGDGAILAVRFDAGQAQGCYRYVATAGYQAETAAGRFLQGGYGSLAPRPWVLRLGSPLAKAVKNTANTSVLALPDRLLALWEAGQPHALDLETLETLGLDDLGSLRPGQGYSAHPKQDPQTGAIFNFGIEAGPVTQLHLYRSDRQGKIQRRSAVSLDGVPLIHDMVLAGRYLVFCISPVRLDLLPALLQLRSFSDALRWRPERGTQIWIFDCETLQPVARNQAPPWFQWHFANGHCQGSGADETLVLTLVRYPDFRSNVLLGEIAQQRLSETLGGQLWQLRINPRKAELQAEDCLYGETCEFPVVSPWEVGQAASVVYFDTHRPEGERLGELMGGLAQLNLASGVLEQFDFGPNRYIASPIYVPHPASEPGEGQPGWIQAVVFDGDRRRSELWIFAARSVAAGPVARLLLPAVIPFGFHGTWQPRTVQGA